MLKQRAQSSEVDASPVKWMLLQSGTLGQSLQKMLCTLGTLRVVIEAPHNMEPVMEPHLSVMFNYASQTFTILRNVETCFVESFLLACFSSQTNISKKVCNQHKENDATGALLLAKTLFKRSLLQFGPVCSLKHFPSNTGDLVAIRQTQVLRL